MKLVLLAFVLCSSLLPSRSIAAASTCGGTAAPMQMTMGYVGSNGGALHARSLEALAAIVDKDSKVMGWLGIDDQAMFWIQPKKDEPLLELMHLPKNGASVFAFVPGKLQLPPGYRVLSCEALSSESS
jgi:hypothetical protein